MITSQTTNSPNPPIQQYFCYLDFTVCTTPDNLTQIIQNKCLQEESLAEVFAECKNQGFLDRTLQPIATPVPTGWYSYLIYDILILGKIIQKILVLNTFNHYESYHWGGHTLAQSTLRKLEQATLHKLTRKTSSEDTSHSVNNQSSSANQGASLQAFLPNISNNTQRNYTPKLFKPAPQPRYEPKIAGEGLWHRGLHCWDFRSGSIGQFDKRFGDDYQHWRQEVLHTKLPPIRFFKITQTTAAKALYLRQYFNPNGSIVETSAVDQVLSLIDTALGESPWNNLNDESSLVTCTK